MPRTSDPCGQPPGHTHGQETPPPHPRAAQPPTPCNGRPSVHDEPRDKYPHLLLVGFRAQPCAEGAGGGPGPGTGWHGGPGPVTSDARPSSPASSLGSRLAAERRPGLCAHCGGGCDEQGVRFIPVSARVRAQLSTDGVTGQSASGSGPTPARTPQRPARTGDAGHPGPPHPLSRRARRRRPGRLSANLSRPRADQVTDSDSR